MFALAFMCETYRLSAKRQGQTVITQLALLVRGEEGSTEVKILKAILYQLILEGRYTPVRMLTPSSDNLDYTEAMATR